QAGALARRARGRRGRRDRADTVELCPCRAHGGLYSCNAGPTAGVMYKKTGIMTEESKTETTTEDLREETAAEAPEVAEHDRVAELEAQLVEAQNATLYARAEAQNLLRRAQKEAEDARAYAATGFARDILSVADNLARALSAIPEELRSDEKLKGLIT